MSFYLLLPKTCYREGTNEIIYEFPQDVKLPGQWECALVSFHFFVSFPNLSPQYKNVNEVITFSFPQYTAADEYTMHDYNVSFQESYLSIDRINFYLQDFCIKNGLYLIDRRSDEGEKFMYFVQAVLNESKYCVDFLTYFIPSEIDLVSDNVVLPDNAQSFINPSMSSDCERISPAVTINNENFGKILGFRQGVIAPSMSATQFAFGDIAYTQSGPLAPSLNAVNSISLRCSICRNQYSIPDDYLSLVPVAARYGALNGYQAPVLCYNSCTTSSFRSISITFYTDDGAPLIFKDKDMSLTLHIRERK